MGVGWVSHPLVAATTLRGRVRVRDTGQDFMGYWTGLEGRFLRWFLFGGGHDPADTVGAHRAHMGGEHA